MTAHVVAGLRAVQVVAGRPDPTDPMPVGAIAQELGTDLSRASRLCSELEDLGLLERGEPYGSYRLGPSATRLSGSAAAPFAKSVRFALTLAAQQTGETVLLAARSYDEIRVIASVESLWTLHSPAEVGELVDDEDCAIARAASGREDDSAGQVSLHESTAGMSVEIAAPVLDPSGQCFSVVAVRLPINRLGQNGPRARRSVIAASRAIARTLEEWSNRPARMPEPAGPDDLPPTALRAALRILLHLAAGPDSVAGTARATGLRPDRTQRLIESCRQAGFLLASLDQPTRFQPTWIVHGWFRAAAGPTMAALGKPLVAETANRTLTCGFITVLKGMRSFTLVEELEMAGEGLRMASWLGRAHPIVGSDGGPTLVMDFTPDELTLLFPARHTPRELKVFLDRVRRVVRDDVLSMEAFDDAGIVSISAPVRDSSGGVVGAACLVGTTEYMRAHVAEFEEAAQQLAARVSALLHGSPASGAPAEGSRTGPRPRARR